MASPSAIGPMVPAPLGGISVKAKPTQKEAVLNLITDFAAKNPKAMGYALAVLVGPVADLTCDIKKEVRVVAVKGMTSPCQYCPVG